MKTIKKVSIGVLSLCILACGGAALSVNSASADTAPEMSFEAGASVRVTTADYGIRFHAYYDATAYGYATDDSTATEVGMIIVPAKALENASEDVFGYLKATYNKDKETVSTAFAASQFTEEADGTYSAYGSIIGILNDNLTLEYQAVAYATADGVNYTYSEASDVRTIAQVLSGALNSSTVSDTMRSKVIDTAVAVQTAAPSVNYTLDIDVKDGLPFALTGDYADYALTAATFGETALTVESGKIKGLTNTDAFTAITTTTEETTDEGGNPVTVTTTTVGDQNEKAMALTFGAKGTLNVNATVWSLIINTAEELTQMNDYYFHNKDNGGDYHIYGYYKLGNDIDMATTPWAVEYSLGRSLLYGADSYMNSNYNTKGFVGVFDGCGYEIQNFNSTVHSAGLVYSLSFIGDRVGTIKNVSFTDATIGLTTKWAGYDQLLCSYVYTGVIENVSIEVAFGWTTRAASGGYYLAGLIGCYSGDVSKGCYLTVKDVTIVNNVAATKWTTYENTMTNTVSKNHFCAVMTVKASTDSTNETSYFKDSVTFENLTVTGFGSLAFSIADIDGDGNWHAVSDLETLNNYFTFTGTTTIN